MNIRQLKGPIGVIIAAYAAMASIFHMYTAGFGVLEPREMRSVHLLFLIPLVFLMYPATKKSTKDRIPWYDYILAALGFCASAYSYLNAERINFRFQGVTDVLPMEILLGTIIVALVIESARRIISKWFCIVPIAGLAYLATAQYLPGIWNARAYSYKRIVEMMYLFVDEGIYGFLMGLSANVLFIYVLFAVFMIKCGVGDYLIELAQALAGGLRGGPAKIAVIASCLYGSVSGSTVANVYATGSVTIPMMKKIGYLPKTAAAIEAAASTGGQIMPPIMGVGAFVMSELTGTPYSTIIKVALVPALLFYFGIITTVHFEAVKRGIMPDPNRVKPDWKNILSRSYMVVPFILIAGLLIYGYSPTKSAYYVIILTAILGFVNPKTKIGLKDLYNCFSEGAYTAAQIAVALASAGIVVTALTRTGAALSFSSMIVHTSGGVLFFVCLMVFVAVALLGTGIPTTAAYIIAVTVGASALGQFGITLLTAHLFVFYYAVFSDLTPPVAVTAFAAATLSGSEMMSTGIEAFKLAISGFIIPFVFIYHPSILWQGTVAQGIQAIFLTAVAIFILSIALVGYFQSKIKLPVRFILGITALMLIFPNIMIQLAGLVVAVTMVGRLYLADKKKTQELPA
jgi:TRAP transporter 4TM/12TM fusion protein